ncbi:FadR/GntR family transcriptional regulator [Aquisalibacillus elongatus]|uniref:GntR family transcriptional regulator n=1 Tax=Aquisalibacillus elongatus TaxID=485577 RepID=A0A3N5BD57_9BACI|nr:GntR family transcriptional regulator [Aquisalibacillus elongatus]RPF55367.1 GntR family transcriptional regulator [Aquisalibacillus elongatus]
MTNSAKIKVYQEVLDQIRLFIEENQLSEGDRLPSERELSEQLNAGRSSVREALRAIELLGLIETRHGEGTFLKTYRPYHTVELLATFVLRQPTTKEELLDVRQMIEHECVSRVHTTLTKSDIQNLKSQILELEIPYIHTHVFNYLFQHVGNELLTKIWHLINNFSQTTFSSHLNQDFYLEFIEALSEHNIKQASGQIKKIYEKY